MLKHSIYLVLSLLIFQACKTHHLIPVTKNQSLSIKPLKGKKLQSSVFEYTLSKTNCWDYQPEQKRLVLTHTEITDSLTVHAGWTESFVKKFDYDMDPEAYDYDTSYYIEWDTFSIVPYVYSKLEIIQFSKNGSIQNRDTIQIEGGIDQVKFFNNKLLIEGWEYYNKRNRELKNSWIDLNDKSRIHTIGTPTLRSSTRRFEFLRSLTTYDSVAFSLQTDYFFQYEIYEYDLRDSLIFEDYKPIPKYTCEQVWNYCSGHDVIKISGDDGILVNDQWFILNTNLNCTGSIIMFEDCFSNARVVAIMDRKNQQLRYLINKSSYTCKKVNEDKKLQLRSRFNWATLQLWENQLLFFHTDRSVVHILDLNKESIAPYQVTENQTFKERAERTEFLLNSMDSIDFKLDPPLEFYPLSNHSILIYNQKKWQRFTLADLQKKLKKLTKL